MARSSKFPLPRRRDFGASHRFKPGLGTPWGRPMWPWVSRLWGWNVGEKPNGIQWFFLWFFLLEWQSIDPFRWYIHVYPSFGEKNNLKLGKTSWGMWTHDCLNSCMVYSGRQLGDTWNNCNPVGLSVQKSACPSLTLKKRRRQTQVNFHWQSSS